MATADVVKALGVAAELMGQEVSAMALQVMAGDLAAYPETAVLAAIQRVRRECRRLVLADIIERIDDGRPGPEEAWQMLPRDEAASAVWTEEMARASAGIDLDDRVAGRMAFLEAYRKAVAQARDRGEPVRWWPTLGTDPHGRKTAVEEAVRQGRLTLERAQEVVPALAYDGEPVGMTYLLEQIPDEG